MGTIPVYCDFISGELQRDITIIIDGDIIRWGDIGSLPGTDLSGPCSWKINDEEIITAIPGEIIPLEIAKKILQTKLPKHESEIKRLEESLAYHKEKAETIRNVLSR